MLLMNKTLLKLARGLWLWILAIAGVGFLTLVGTTALAEIIAGFLGTLFQPQAILNTAWSAIRAALAAAVFTFLAQLLKGLLEYRTAAKAREGMRKMIFSKVLELDAGGIEKIGPVSAITASVDAVEQMQTYFSTYLPSLIYSVIAPIYLFFHLKNISMPVAVLLLVVSLFLLPINNAFRSRIEDIRKIYWRSLDDMTGYYMDSLRGLTTLKLFDRDREHSRILGEKADILNKNINCFMKINFTSFLVTEALIYAALVIALVDSCVRITKGSITISQALIVLMLSYSYFSSAQQLMSASHSALTAISAAGKVEEILDTDTTRPFDPSLPEDKEHFNGIRMEHVSYGYEGRARALQDVSLTIPKGSVVALVGLSGCGKSTTLRMITGLDEPTSGDIYIDGKKINDLTPGKRDIAMVFQNYALYPTMTVRENIEFGLENKKVPKEERKKRVQEICEVVGLTQYLDRKPATLSGGQRQRVALARAMVKQPKVFLMDEPLSNLDAKLRGQMRVELIGLHKKLGTTFVYVTHDQVEAMSMADDIVLMKDGYIVQQSSPRELYNNPNCVYAAQFIGTPQMNIVKDILPEGMQVGFRPEKVYLKEVEEEHVEISAKIATKEMLGSEIIYSLDSPAGKLMAKSDYEAEDESTLKLSIPVKNMYLFDKDGKRITLDDERRLMIHAGFAKLAGREV